MADEHSKRVDCPSTNLTISVILVSLLSSAAHGSEQEPIGLLSEAFTRPGCCLISDETSIPLLYSD